MFEWDKAISSNSHLSLWNFSNGGTHLGPWTILLSVPGWSSQPVQRHMTRQYSQIMSCDDLTLILEEKILCVPQILSSMWPLSRRGELGRTGNTEVESFKVLDKGVGLLSYGKLAMPVLTNLIYLLFPHI